MQKRKFLTSPLGQVLCLECNQAFKIISTSHLRYKHNMTHKEYALKYKIYGRGQFWRRENRIARQRRIKETIRQGKINLYTGYNKRPPADPPRGITNTIWLKNWWQELSPRQLQQYKQKQSLAKTGRPKGARFGDKIRQRIKADHIHCFRYVPRNRQASRCIYCKRLLRNCSS